MLDIGKIETALAGSHFIEKVIYSPEIDSTNLYSRALENDSSILVLTDYQIRGMGRQNKSWESEKGKNLTFTIKKRFNVELKSVQTINFYFTYFLVALLKDFIAKNRAPGTVFPDVSIKWPNDIILDSKKISGLLIENNIKKQEFIIGIGININQQKFSQKYPLEAGSLKNFLKKDINLSEFLIGLIKTYEKNEYLLNERNYGLIFTLWKNSSMLINKEVSYIVDKDNIDYGKVIDLQEDGSILIEQNGNISTYYSGEIRLQL